MYPGEFIEAFEAIDFEAMALEILPKLLDYIAELNRWQMGKGLGYDGEYMPSYLNDPFFETRQQAVGYMLYKKKVSPNTQKPVDIIDYYVNGYTHDRVVATISGSDVTMIANVEWMDKMIQNRALGLNEASLKELRSEMLYPMMVLELKERIGLEM